ncbi:MAG: class I SAM-dependent methyltransferase [Limnothrix sp. RL_2_0]|nr:class I SAM-dependent methyltransferase [Limnothrix sp. RL_2_0]
MSNNFFDRKQGFFDRWAPNYDIIFTTPFYQAVHKRMLTYADFPADGYVLDLGCGTGKLFQRLGKLYPKLTGTGLDLSPEMIAQAQTKNIHGDRFHFSLGNAEAQPFRDNTFDVAFNTISFLHYPNPETVLTEVWRVLKPGGKFYLADFGKGELIQGQAVPFSPGGIRFYSRDERTKMGDQVNFFMMAHHYLMFGVLLTIWQKPVS